MSGQLDEILSSEKDVQRFWSKIDRRGPDECWEWKQVRKEGYGAFCYGDKRIKAHRLSFMMHHRPLYEGEYVCHTCDNPPCVNPNHLWAGTHAQNMADMAAKGRSNSSQKTGEGNSNSTLTIPEVMAIRVLWRNHLPQSQIATFLGCSKATVSLVCNEGRWASHTEANVSACVNAMAGVDDPIAMMAEIEDVLTRVAEHLDRYSDVNDGDYGEPEANKEMLLLSAIKPLLSRMGGGE